MTDFVVKFTGGRQLRAFAALANLFDDRNVRQALRDLSIAKEDLLTLTQAEALQLVDKLEELGFEARRGHREGPDHEYTFEIFRNVQRPTGGTVVDEFGNTVPEYVDYPGVFLYYRHNGNGSLQPLNVARQVVGATIEWRSDNEGATPLPEWFPRIG